jgi:diguanylate cyclase (GGDEF)-like protein
MTLSVAPRSPPSAAWSLASAAGLVAAAPSAAGAAEARVIAPLAFEPMPPARAEPDAMLLALAISLAAMLLVVWRGWRRRPTATRAEPSGGRRSTPRRAPAPAAQAELRAVMLAGVEPFRERLVHTLARCLPDQRPFAVLHLDIDHAAAVFQRFGPVAGEILVRKTAERLRASMRRSDCIAHLGGDKFLILQLDIASEDDTVRAIERVLAAVGEPHLIAGQPVRVTASIGVAFHPADGVTAEDLLGKAELALCQAKADGRGTFRVFDAARDARLKDRRQMERALREALAAGRLDVFYQPLVDAQTSEIRAFEALLRWPVGPGSFIPPAEFIPLAEQAGLIGTLGEFVLRRACQDAAAWHPDVRVSVNLSPLQLLDGGLPEFITQTLAETGLAARRLELEITEGALITNPETAYATLQRLRALGVDIAMDDFGTGYSSLSYLQSFPFDRIKIDRSFVQNLGARREALPIVQAVIGLGRGLDMSVVAEGVETDAQLKTLRALGCSEVQGYLIARPMTLEKARAFLAGVAERPKPALAARMAEPA